MSASRKEGNGLNMVNALSVDLGWITFGQEQKMRICPPHTHDSVPFLFSFRKYRAAAALCDELPYVSYTANI